LWRFASNNTMTDMWLCHFLMMRPTLVVPGCSCQARALSETRRRIM